MVHVAWFVSYRNMHCWIAGTTEYFHKIHNNGNSDNCSDNGNSDKYTTTVTAYFIWSYRCCVFYALFPASLFNFHIQGGVNSELTITAYVTIALLEAGLDVKVLYGLLYKISNFVSRFGSQQLPWMRSLLGPDFVQYSGYSGGGRAGRLRHPPHWFRGGGSPPWISKDSITKTRHMN